MDDFDDFDFEHALGYMHWAACSALLCGAEGAPHSDTVHVFAARNAAASPRRAPLCHTMSEENAMRYVTISIETCYADVITFSATFPFLGTS